MTAALRRSMRVLAALTAFTFVAGGADAADTANVGTAIQNQKPAKKKQAKTVRSAKPSGDPGSHETASQRSARLQRECKGAVNAGACAGYTR